MRKTFYIFFFFTVLLAVALVSCKEQMSNEVVVQNKNFTVYPDSVCEGEWTAKVMSPTHIVSNYAPTDTTPLTSDGIVRFRLAFNGHDNELPKHTYHYAAMGRDTTITAFEVKAPPAKKGDIYATEWHLKVDLREMENALKTDGLFCTPTGDTIHREEYKGVWIAGNIPPLSWDFFGLEQNTSLKLHPTDSAGIYEITIPLHVRPQPITYLNEWKIDRENPDYPSIKTPMPIIDALYNMSISDVASAMVGEYDAKMLPREANHTRISYPIMLSLAFLCPKEAIATLKSAVENGIISHKHKSNLWPINTDDISWAMAAWEIYTATGDKEWLKWAYEVIKRTITEEYEINADNFTGLIHGGGQFAFSQGQFYPSWMEYKDIYECASLSSNVFFERAFEILNDMADELGIEDSDNDYGAMAQNLKDAINEALWNEQLHHYFQYSYVYASPVQSPVIDNFAQAMSVLWNIASDDRAENLMMFTPISPYGITIACPRYQSESQINLSEVVSPMVLAFWNLAAAKSENETMLRYGLGAMYRAQALFCANKGAFNGYTGMPLGSGKGDIASAAGNLAMVFRIYAGMTFLPNGIEFNPFVPVFLNGKKEIRNFKYRNATLDITIEGTGNVIDKFFIDGKETNDNFINAELTGTHNIRIVMASNAITRQQVTLANGSYCIPATPIVNWRHGGGKLLNFSADARYRMIINGQVRYSIADTAFTLQAEKPSFTANSVISIGGKNFSYISKPHYVMKEAQILPFSSFATAGTALTHNDIASTSVEMSIHKNAKIDINVNVPSGGDYYIDIRYANGASSAFCPTVCVKANTHRQGTIVLPCRGANEWLNYGWSNIIKAELMRGRNTISVERIGNLGADTPVLLHTIRIAKK